MNPVKQAINQMNAHLNGHLPLAVAWSGGLDSTVLLHALNQAGYRVHALHVNHGLQAVSPDFERFCFELSKDWSVPLEVIHLDASQVKGSVETWAREQRYYAMCEWMINNQLDHLVLAHHLDDQIETALLQLLRGSGLRGLGGMRAVLPVGVQGPGFNKLSLIRPFLKLHKADLLQYARDHQIDCIEDPTNSELDYKRNWVRLKLLPEMREHFPQTDQAIERLAEFTDTHYQALDSVTRDLLNTLLTESGLCLKKWRMLSKPAQLETLRLWLQHHQIRCGRDKLVELHRQLLNDAGGKRQVAGQWAVLIKKSTAIVTFI